MIKHGTTKTEPLFSNIWMKLQGLRYVPVCKVNPWWLARSPACRWGRGWRWFPSVRPDNVFLMLWFSPPCLPSVPSPVEQARSKRYKDFWEIWPHSINRVLYRQKAGKNTSPCPHSSPLNRSNLADVPLVFGAQLFALQQVFASGGQLRLQLGHAVGQAADPLSVLGQLFIGFIQQFLQLHAPAVVIVGIDGAIGKPLSQTQETVQLQRFTGSRPSFLDWTQRVTWAWVNDDGTILKVEHVYWSPALHLWFNF